MLSEDALDHAADHDATSANMHPHHLDEQHRLAGDGLGAARGAWYALRPALAFWGVVGVVVRHLFS